MSMECSCVWSNETCAFHARQNYLSVQQGEEHTCTYHEPKWVYEQYSTELSKLEALAKQLSGVVPRPKRFSFYSEKRLDTAKIKRLADEIDTAYERVTEAQARMFAWREEARTRNCMTHEEWKQDFDGRYAAWQAHRVAEMKRERGEGKRP